MTGARARFWLVWLRPVGDPAEQPEDALDSLAAAEQDRCQRSEGKGYRHGHISYSEGLTRNGVQVHEQTLASEDAHTRAERPPSGGCVRLSHTSLLP
jgi:hypothetical protein